ncbi:hypothetical protein DEI93_03265 [Curtobacterium sp. MCBD17_035]|uniref:hypothetical protein n=1 Tax=Curtobacterium sp. MCBD17_035 TaxID=2175673 RepID=UPI000DAA1886|nr:hypothetical protein [Curtobacterium sp. MCBD17_035]WIB68077.1 hypothetical protein DEI93_03265 [Curtobacterium sp. MCBD17_035]
MSTKSQPSRELTPAEIIAQAEAEYLAAQQHVETVEAQIAAGDEDLTPEDLDKAKSVSRFADLRRAAAERKAARAAAKQQRAHTAKVIDDNIIATQGLEQQIDPLLQQARVLIDQALEITKRHDRAVFAIAELAETEGNPYSHDDDPDVIGLARPGAFELTWFETRGVRGEVYGSQKVLTRLTSQYRNRSI